MSLTNNFSKDSVAGKVYKSYILTPPISNLMAQATTPTDLKGLLKKINDEGKFLVRSYDASGRANPEYWVDISFKNDKTLKNDKKYLNIDAGGPILLHDGQGTDSNFWTYLNPQSLASASPEVRQLAKEISSKALAALDAYDKKRGLLANALLNEKQIKIEKLETKNPSKGYGEYLANLTVDGKKYTVTISNRGVAVHENTEKRFESVTYPIYDTKNSPILYEALSLDSKTILNKKMIDAVNQFHQENPFVKRPDWQLSAAFPLFFANGGMGFMASALSPQTEQLIKPAQPSNP